MRLLLRLEAKQKSGAIRYLLFRQSPKSAGLAQSMKLRNVHERKISRSSTEVGKLSDGLASANHGLWPHECWSAMTFARPLQVDANGGHGPVRYFVQSYEPGRNRFEFTRPKGFNGFHGYEIEEVDSGTTVLGLIPAGGSWSPWVKFLRWLFRRINSSDLSGGHRKTGKEKDGLSDNHS